MGPSLAVGRDRSLDDRADLGRGGAEGLGEGPGDGPGDHLPARFSTSRRPVISDTQPGPHIEAENGPRTSAGSASAACEGRRPGRRRGHPRFGRAAPLHRAHGRRPRPAPYDCVVMPNNTDRTAWLVGLVGALVLGMPAVGSGQGTVADDRAALEALYDATNGANWSRNDNWKTDEPLGQWFGVRTSDGRVVRLELYDNQLSGTIPGEIGNLTSLTGLFLSENQLSGTIPGEIGNLTSLTQLYLTNNQLSGTIPGEIGNLTSLTSLFLNGNQLSGTIPAQLRNLTSLVILRLDDNQLSGTIPGEIGNLTSLISLGLGGNQLSGTIPAQLRNLTSLIILRLDDNQLSGTIPGEIGNLTSLFDLYLNDNQLSGQIPAALGKLTSLMGLGIDTTTGLCLAPDFDLTSPFATLSGLPVCTAVPALPAVAVALLGLLLAAVARRRATKS